jgi:hypothetical protein
MLLRKRPWSAPHEGRAGYFSQVGAVMPGTPTKIDEGIPITSFELSIEWVSLFV